MILVLLIGRESALFNTLDILAIVLALLWWVWNLIDWLNDYFIVTNKRVAHRERLLFIREARDEAPLDKVQNVNIDQRFWGNLLGFGSLVIDTAAGYGGGRVRFDYLGNPGKVQQLIFEEMSRVRASDRDWTIVRVPMLTNSPAAGSLKIGYLGQGVGTRLSRADLAAFMLRQVDNTTYLRQAPVVSN